MSADASTSIAPHPNTIPPQSTTGAMSPTPTPTFPLSTTATAPSLSPTASSHSQGSPSMPSATHSSSSSRMNHSYSNNHNPSLSPSESNERQIAEARAFLSASMQNIGSSLDRTLQSRAQNLHDNSKVLERQQKEVVKATEALRKENEKLGKMASEGSRKVKELGNVQNWAEMLERDFLVLGEWVRLVDKGSEDDEDWESGSSYTGSESEDEDGEGGKESAEGSGKETTQELNGQERNESYTNAQYPQNGNESIEGIETDKAISSQHEQREADADPDGDLEMQDTQHETQHETQHDDRCKTVEVDPQMVGIDILDTHTDSTPTTVEGFDQQMADDLAPQVAKPIGEYEKNEQALFQDTYMGEGISCNGRNGSNADIEESTHIVEATNTSSKSAVNVSTDIDSNISLASVDTHKGTQAFS